MVPEKSSAFRGDARLSTLIEHKLYTIDVKAARADFEWLLKLLTIDKKKR